MLFLSLRSIIFAHLPSISKRFHFQQQRKCYSIFGIQDLVQHEKVETFTILPVKSDNHEMAVNMAKRYFLNEHIFVRERNMDLNNDRAIDEYLVGLLKQGNSLYAKAGDGTVAGFCINFAVSPVDPQNLRNYAFYRQHPNTKDFMYFTAKLQETPNLWNTFKEDKVFEIKMLAVIPEYRRQGLATNLAEKSKSLALDLGHRVVRMDCVNTYDYKIAERCMLSCLVKFPLHKLRGATAPFIKRNSEYNRYVRVYVNTPFKHDSPNLKQADFENCVFIRLNPITHNISAIFYFHDISLLENANK